jgi:hypothetical protein
LHFRLTVADAVYGEPDGDADLTVVLVAADAY